MTVRRLVLLAILLVTLATPAAAELPPKPDPLPLLELPPKPADPQGAPQAREASRLIHAGDYEGALLLYREAWSKGVYTQTSMYNGACAAAVTGHADEAFVWLDRAIEAGYRSVEHAKADSDLDSLREDSRFASFLARATANGHRFGKENNNELRTLYEADQSARRGNITADDWPKIVAADKERRAGVAEIVAAGEAKSGADYYHAAMVYQHGDSLEDYARAREYAAKAVTLGEERGRWLAAAAWDRWLRNAGYPQRFGTQYMCPKDEGCHLQPWDESVTDEERARWNVPTIEEALARAKEM